MTTDQPQRVRTVLWYWGPVIAYMAVIFLGSSASTLPDLPGGISDKIAHAGEYAVLGFVLVRALAGKRWLSLTAPYAIAAVALAALYGMSDEFHQSFVPHRDVELGDVIADTAGAFVSVGALWLWGIIKRFF